MTKIFLEEVAVNTQRECDCAGWLQAVALLLLLQTLGSSLLGTHLLTTPPLPPWGWCWNIWYFKYNGETATDNSI